MWWTLRQAVYPSCICLNFVRPASRTNIPLSSFMLPLPSLHSGSLVNILHLNLHLSNYFILYIDNCFFVFCLFIEIWLQELQKFGDGIFFIFYMTGTIACGMQRLQRCLHWSQCRERSKNPYACSLLLIYHLIITGETK